MKTTVAKTFRTIFIVLAVVLLIITAVLYFIDTPVVEEGQEPTTAQKVILLGKDYLSEILLACGASGIGLMGVLTKLIYNSANKTLTQSLSTSADILTLTNRLKDNEQTIAALTEIIGKMSKKQDIANNMLMTTFSLSELPASLREQIHNAQTEYNGLDKTVKIVEQIAETAKNADESEEQTAKIEDNSVIENVKADEPSNPVYL